jgi:signal transduction histidine kinase
LHGAPTSWLSVLVKLRDTLESRLAHAGIALQWMVDDIGERLVPDAKSVHNFRYLMSEAITNVIKHADAKTVFLKVDVVGHTDKAELLVQVCDDGRGMDSMRPNTGYGLKNMAARASALNAVLAFTPLNPGTCVEIRLALREPFKN